MTTIEPVVFDTWALWEVFQSTPTGKTLETRFQVEGRNNVVSAWALAELAAKIDLHAPGHVEGIVRSVRDSFRVVPVSADLGLQGARLRTQLRRQSARASLGDGVMLATARELGMKLVSGDSAFKGQPDVIR